MKLAIKPAPEDGQGPGRRPRGPIAPPAVQLILEDGGVDRLQAGPFVGGVIALIDQIDGRFPREADERQRLTGRVHGVEPVPSEL